MPPQQSSNTLTRTSHLVPVEHLEVWTAKPFAEVVRRLEAETGIFDAAAIQARIQAKAPPSTVIEAIAAMAGRSGFMRFAALDHGAILRLQGRSAEAVRYLIGHPLTGSRPSSVSSMILAWPRLRASSTRSLPRSSTPSWAWWRTSREQRAFDPGL